MNLHHLVLTWLICSYASPIMDHLKLECYRLRKVPTLMVRINLVGSIEIHALIESMHLGIQC
jgi:hypothetical protein